MQKTNLSKGVLLFTVGMIVTKFSSFFVNIALTWKYGAGSISDAIILSTSIPTILFAGLITAVSMCYVPIIKEVEINNSSRKNEVTSNVLNGLSGVVLIICIFMFFNPETIVTLLANGISKESAEMATKITRFVAVACIMSAGTGVLQGFLQASNRFRLVSLSSLPINIFLTIGISISKDKNLTSIIGGSIIGGYLIQLFVFIYESYKIGYRWKPTINLKDEYIKRLLIMVLPVLVSTLIYDLNSIIDKNFASFLDSGSISILDYSYKVSGAAQGILAYPLTTILYTQLSEASSKKDINELKHTLSTGVERLSLYMIPTISLMIITADWIISILFGRGSFDRTAINQTSQCMVFYLIGMFAVSYRAMFEKVFYSIGKTTTTLINVIITVIANVIMDFVGYRIWGCNGLAIATSVSMFVSLFFMWTMLSKKHNIRLDKQVKRVFRNVSIAVVAMAIVAMLVKYVFSLIYRSSIISEMIGMVIVLVCGITTFFCTLLILKEPYALAINNKLFRRKA